MAVAVADPGASPAIPRNRLIAGVATLASGIATKVIGPALIIASELSTQWKALLTGVLFIAIPKIFLILTILVLGKDGFAFVKGKIVDGVGAALRPLAPARDVSPARYALGLLMFWLPIAELWAMPYLTVAFPESTVALRRWDFGSDVMLVASFFVLGGDFWDKLRAPFVHSARVVFPAQAATAHPHSATPHLIAAVLLLVAGQVGFLVIRPMVVASELTDFAKALLGACFVLLPGIAVVAAVLALGRAGSRAVHRRFPAVGLARHRIGLVLIGVPLLGGIVVDYIVGTYAPFQGRFKVLLDLLLLGGVLALGPDFWDKLQALFQHGAKARLASEGGPVHQ